MNAISNASDAADIQIGRDYVINYHVYDLSFTVINYTGETPYVQGDNNDNIFAAKSGLERQRVEKK